MTTGSTWLFIGDSITDSGRTTEQSIPLGDGYVSMIDSQLVSEDRSITVINRGIAGNTVLDLVARLDQDCIALQPDLISVLIGVNDAAAKSAGADDSYEAVYREMLQLISRNTQARIVLIQPFLWPLNAEQLKLVEDLALKAALVESLADEFSATLVPAHAALQSSDQISQSPFSDDGVHLNVLGNKTLASLWSNTVLA